jgi:hypothetical protein
MMREEQAGAGLLDSLRACFSQMLTTTLVQQIAPRRTTGDGNVTRSADTKQHAIELSQTRSCRGSKMQQRAFDREIVFRVRRTQARLENTTGKQDEKNRS